MVCPFFFIEKAVESASTSSWDQTPTGYSGNQNYRHYCTRIPGVLYSVRLHWSLGSSRSWCHRYALAWSRGLPKHVLVQRDQPYHLYIATESEDFAAHWNSFLTIPAEKQLSKRRTKINDSKKISCITVQEEKKSWINLTRTDSCCFEIQAATREEWLLHFKCSKRRKAVKNKKKNVGGLCVISPCPCQYRSHDLEHGWRTAQQNLARLEKLSLAK